MRVCQDGVLTRVLEASLGGDDGGHVLCLQHHDLAQQHVLEAEGGLGVVQLRVRLEGLEEVGEGRRVVLLLRMQHP